MRAHLGAVVNNKIQKGHTLSFLRCQEERQGAEHPKEESSAVLGIVVLDFRLADWIFGDITLAREAWGKLLG